MKKFMMPVFLLPAGLALLALPTPVEAKGEAYEWQDVERIVAVGDLHGDYDQFRKVMSAAGLIDDHGRWAGGKTHLVQTGDIVDRGPDSARIIEHLQDLAKQARRKGGRVHTLIGNHEAMNVYGDLRYVHEGEYAHFVGRKSEALRERQWAFTLQQLEQTRPEQFAQLDQAAYRLEWEQRFPLGWVEHRNAWGTAGALGQWVLENPVAVKINGTIFLHGGLSAKYCHMSLAEISERAHAEMRDFDPQNPGMIEDPEGPLWYRGLAQDDEAALRPVVDAILERYGAERIVVGHTPTGGVVWPRFEGRVVANDTGIAAYYGGHDAFLELGGGVARARYGANGIELPRDAAGRADYLREVMALNPGNPALQKRLAQVMAPVEAGAPLDASGAETLSPDMCR